MNKFLGIFCLSLVFLWITINEAQETPMMFALDWNPNGEEIAIATEIGVQIYDVETQDIQTLEGNSEQVIAVDWSPDGEYIAAIGYPYEYDPTFLYVPVFTSSILIWQRNHNSEFELVEQIDYPEQTNVVDLAWSPDGTKLAVRESEYLAPRGDVAFGAIRIWDAISSPLVEMSITEHSYREWYSVIAWSPDSTKIVSSAEVWCYELRPCNSTVDDPFGTLIFISDTLTGERIAWSRQSPFVYGISWGTNDKIAVSSFDFLIYNDDLSERLTIDKNFNDYGVTWMPDNERLLVWGFGEINVLDAATFETENSIEFHSDLFWLLHTVALSPDAAQIAYINDDTRVEIYTFDEN